jgi:hypothetical protein
MKRLFQFSQRSKPEVSVTSYAPVFRAALEVLGRRPSGAFSGEFVYVRPEWAASEIERMQGQAEYWERLNAARLDLEAVWPEHRLQDAHMEAVKLLRGALEVLNSYGEVVIRQLEGDPADKAQRDYLSWSHAYGRVEGKFIAALEHVLRTQPELYAVLDTPAAFLRSCQALPPGHPLLRAAGIADEEQDEEQDEE